MTLMGNKFTKKKGACNTLKRVIDLTHLTVPLPTIDCAVPSAICMLFEDAR